PPVTRLVMAARYLTIVPIPGPAPSREGPGAAAAWFPVVGLAIGALLVLVDRAVIVLFAPLLAALLTVTVWQLVTGGLHLVVVALVIAAFMTRRIGGLSGDVHGATVEFAELVVLLTVAAISPAR